MYSSAWSPALFLAHVFFFFFNDTATTEIYTLSLHDALQISYAVFCLKKKKHTSQLQSPSDLACRLLITTITNRRRKPATIACLASLCSSLSCLLVMSPKW